MTHPGSNEHFFGLFDGRIDRETANMANRIAHRNGAYLTCYDDPARGPRGWFACRNRGEPFDSATAAAVLAELEAADLWPLPVAA